MQEIPIELVNLKEATVFSAFVSKDKVKEFLNIKTGKYYYLKKEFEALISEGKYPVECFISIGNVELFNIYALLHFLTYRNKYKERYWRERVPAFDARKYKKIYESLGVV